MKTLLKLTIPVFFLLSSCSSSTSKITKMVKVNGLEIPVVQLSEVSPAEKELKMSDLFESLDIVPLETAEECLIENVTLKMDEENIFLSTQYNFPDPARLYRFNRQGEFLNSIGTPGRGPGEHELYLVMGIEMPGNGTVLVEWKPAQVFSYEGEHLYNLKAPNQYINGFFPLVNGDFVYMGGIVGHPARPTDSLYLMVFDKQGTIKHVIPRRKYPKTNKAIYTYGDRQIYKYNNQIKVRNAGNDTLYQMEGYNLIPQIVFQHGTQGPSVYEVTAEENIPGSRSYSICAETEDLFLLQETEVLKFEGRISPDGKAYWGGSWPGIRMLYVSKEKGQAAYLEFEDDMSRMLPSDMIPHGTMQNTFQQNKYAVYSMNAMQAIHMADSVLLRDDLPSPVRERVSDMRSKIDVESNPVLFIFTLKDKIKL